MKLRHVAKFRESPCRDGRESVWNEKIDVKHDGRSLLRYTRGDHNNTICTTLENLLVRRLIARPGIISLMILLSL